MSGVTDIDAMLSSGLPSAEAFLQITQSKSIVTFMMCWIIIVYFSKAFLLPLRLEKVGANNHVVSLPSQWVTAGRMTWAFARDVSSYSPTTHSVLPLTSE